MAIMMPEGLKKFRCKASDSLIRDACFHAEEIGSAAYAGAAALDRAAYVCECADWFIEVENLTIDFYIGTPAMVEWEMSKCKAWVDLVAALDFYKSFNK